MKRRAWVLLVATATGGCSDGLGLVEFLSSEIKFRFDEGETPVSHEMLRLQLVWESTVLHEIAGSELTGKVGTPGKPPATWLTGPLSTPVSGELVVKWALVGIAGDTLISDELPLVLRREVDHWVRFDVTVFSPLPCNGCLANRYDLPESMGVEAGVAFWVVYGSRFRNCDCVN